MGERYQSHIRVKFEDESKKDFCLSIHLQWCWDIHIIRNMHRLMNTLKKTDLKYIYEGELKEYIKAIFTVNKSLKNRHYFYRISVEEPYETFGGDSNHGWCVISLSISQKSQLELTSRFYDINGKPKTNDNLWDNCKSSFKYYKMPNNEITKIRKMLDSGLFNNTEEDLQTLFNGLIKNKSKTKKVV